MRKGVMSNDRETLDEGVEDTGGRLPITECVALAAQCWCTDRTKNSVMDVDVAWEFSRLLYKITNGEAYNE